MRGSQTRKWGKSKQNFCHLANKIKPIYTIYLKMCVINSTFFFFRNYSMLKTHKYSKINISLQYYILHLKFKKNYLLIFHTYCGFLFRYSFETLLGNFTSTTNWQFWSVMFVNFTSFVHCQRHNTLENSLF